MDEPTCVVCDFPLRDHVSEFGPSGVCEDWTHPMWNVDGTPKRPETNPHDSAVTAFADMAYRSAEEERRDAYVNYAKMRAEAMRNQAAVVGDVVHLWYDARCLAAIVVRAGDFQEDMDVLHVFSDEPGQSGVTNALHSETRILGTWHWPENQ